MWPINYCSKFILLAAAMFVAANHAAAQSYYHAPNDTIVSRAAFGDINVYNIIQKHPGADTLYFKWYKHSVTMPLSWEASICDNGNCHTSLKDSGMMAPIVPGDDGLMSLHLDPKFEAGTGIIRYTIFATSSPWQTDTLTWIITAGGSTGIAADKNPQPFIYKGPGQIICTKLGHQFSTAKVFDMNGKLLTQQNISGDEAIIPTPGYYPKIVLLQLSGKRHYLIKISTN